MLQEIIILGHCEPGTESPHLWGTVVSNNSDLLPTLFRSTYPCILVVEETDHLPSVTPVSLLLRMDTTQEVLYASLRLSRTLPEAQRHVLARTVNDLFFANTTRYERFLAWFTPLTLA